MDKTQHISSQNKSQKGFALIITLSVLSVIIALTMVLLSYFEKVHQDASNTKALIQADVFYSDITSIFQGFKNKKTLFSLLYTTALPLNTDDNSFAVLLQCRPLSGGVNINWLGLDNSTKNEARQIVAFDLFEAIAQDYNIEDASRLLEMLHEEIGNKNKPVIKEQSRLHQKNGIISYKQFSDIISRYQFEVDDSKIGSVPWKKYFSFSSKEAKKIDVEYSSAELIAFLFEIDISTAKEWTSSLGNENSIEKKPTLKIFIDDNGGNYGQRKSILADKFLDETECSVSYTLAEERYRFRFEYIQGEAKYFEFYGKQ